MHKFRNKIWPRNCKTLHFAFFSSGEHGGYSRNSHHPSVSSVYSTLPHVQVTPNFQGPMRTRQVRLSTDLDLDLSGGHYTPLTTPIVIETQQTEGPICASSPKRTVSAFTTFGPSRSNVTTPLSPNGGSPTMPNSTSTSTLGGGPATGHLVWFFKNLVFVLKAHDL